MMNLDIPNTESGFWSDELSLLDDVGSVGFAEYSLEQLEVDFEQQDFTEYELRTNDA